MIIGNIPRCQVIFSLAKLASHISLATFYSEHRRPSICSANRSSRVEKAQKQCSILLECSAAHITAVEKRGAGGGTSSNQTLEKNTSAAFHPIRAQSEEQGAVSARLSPLRRLWRLARLQNRNPIRGIKSYQSAKLRSITLVLWRHCSMLHV